MKLTAYDDHPWRCQSNILNDEAARAAAAMAHGEVLCTSETGTSAGYLEFGVWGLQNEASKLAYSSNTLKSIDTEKGDDLFLHFILAFA